MKKEPQHFNSIEELLAYVEQEANKRIRMMKDDE
jgi:hypothetical protein